MEKVRIASRGQSFRRAGLSFTREGQVFGPDELTDEQIAAIRVEPNLIVTPVEQTDDVDGKGKSKSKPKDA